MPRSPERPGGPAALVIAVDEPSRVGEVRRAAAVLGREAGLGETEAGALAIVATEIATNLALHATGGRVLLRAMAEHEAGGVELLALDTGPGMRSLVQSLEDGYSTAGTAGKGLGAIRRMADDFDVYSRIDAPPLGTALVVRLRPARARRGAPAGDLLAGVVCVPVAGESVCGDAWMVLRDGARTLVAVADGLGHGPDAALAASEAMRVVREHAEAGPGALVQLAHAALRPTRGAALAVAAVEPARRTITYAGVGNIVAAVHTPDRTRSLPSHNGTVGHAMRTVQEFRHDWPAGATLVLHTDGINTRWRLDGYPGVLQRDPVLLAGLLFRDAARGRDDATVLVLREP